MIQDFRDLNLIPIRDIFPNSGLSGLQASHKYVVPLRTLDDKV